MNKPRILIVEDEAIIARDIRQQLIKLGYEPVATATRGEEAITLAGGLRPDLVLMDIHLAGKTDGIAAAKTIREQFTLPSVFLTAFADDDMLNRAKQAEPFGYIIKPFEERELRSVIEVALYKHAAEMRLRQSHEMHDAILRTALDGYWLVDLQGRVLDVNDACCQMHGYSREEMVGKSVTDFEMEDTPEEIAAITEHIVQAGSARFEGRHRCKNGPPIDLELNINYLPHAGGRFFAFMRDITARKRVQEERDLTVRLLEVVNGQNNLHDLMQAATLLLRDWSGCSTVGIRLKVGDEFPYFEVRGYPGKFVHAESRLCQHDATGKVVSDSAGHPVLECLCGNIFAGRFDPAKPYFTAHGSFWTNSTTDLLANTTEAERQARTRNCCRGEDYESMALVPMRVDGNTLGLLQLNDRRRDQFTPERIKFFERLADSLGIAIAYRTANEETLRSERKFRSFIEHSPLGVFVVDRAGRYLEVNPAGARMMGYSEAELLQMRVHDLLAADTLNFEISPAFARLLTQGSVNTEVLLRRKDGTEFWASLVAAKLDDERFIGFNQDITERKQAAEKLRINEERLQQTIRCAEIGIFDHDHHTNTIYWSAELRRIYGWPADAPATLADYISLLHPGHLEEIGQAVHRAHDPAGDGLFDVELRIVRPSDGEVRWITTRSQTFFEGEGAARHPVRTVGAVMDVTDRNRAEAALRESRALLQTIIDGIPDAIYVKNLLGQYLLFNRGSEKITGKSVAEVLGKDDTSLFSPAAAEAIGDTDRKVLESGKEKTFEEVVTIAPGESFTFLTTKGPLFDAHGKVSGLFGIARNITERKQAEAALRESEERYRSLVELSPQAILVHREGKLTYVNEAAATLAGAANPAALIGKSIKDFVHPDHWEAMQARMRRAYELRQPTPLEAFLFRRLDGQIGHAEISGVPIVLEGEASFLTIVRDITERKLAEEALRASEERYRDLFAANPHPMCVYDSATLGFLAVNDAAVACFGYSAEDFRSMTIMDLVPPGDMPRLRETIGAQTGPGINVTKGWRSKRKDGTLIDVELSSHPVSFAGRPARVVLATDVTARQRAEEQLRSSQAELAAIYDHAPIVMCLLDADRRIVHLNNAAAALGWDKRANALGLRPGDLICCGNSLDDPRGCGFGTGCETCVLRQAIQETLDTGQSHLGVETRLRVTSGPKPSDCHVIAHMARLEIGGQKRVLLCLEDVTHRKRTEEALRRTEEQFRQAQKMEAVGQLAGGVAHDFNNILAAVLMYLGLLQDEPGMDRKIRASLKELEKEVHRGAALTRQLLAFSRHQAMEPKVLNLHEVVAGLLKMLRRLLGEHIKLTLHGPPDLPRTEADPSMLEQVVINLCVNARDAMPQGGQLALYLDAVDLTPDAAANADARPGRFLRLSVADTGSGMDEPTMRRIFEPFFTTKGVGKGTGLGLATVYGIVKQHRGWIDVESTVGRGSTFHVYLPVSDAPAALAAGPERPRPAGGRNELVLVVEDEAMVRNVVATTLQRNGYRTIQAANGPEALKVWEKHGAEIELLFTDLLMPGGMTGRELADQLRQKKPGLKVIIFTGYGKEKSTDPFDDGTGSITVLRKPADSEVLLGTVRRCLDVANPG